MNKSLLKMAIIAVVVGSLPKLNRPIGDEKVQNKYIPVGCTNFKDYIRRDTINLCGNDALNYIQPTPSKLQIGNSEYMQQVNDKLSSISFTSLGDVHLSNGNIDYYHDILVPTGLTKYGPLADYTVGIFSNTNDNNYRVTNLATVTVEVPLTNGEAYGKTFTITDAMHKDAKKYLNNIFNNLTENYIVSNKSASSNKIYSRTSINGYYYPFAIKKYALYMPIRFDEYSYCTKATCGLEQGSYISSVSYKLLLINSWDCKLMYKETYEGKSKYYFDLGVKPMTIDELNNNSAYTYGYLDANL